MSRVFLLTAALALGACAPTDRMNDPASRPASAVATVAPTTAPGAAVTGTVRFDPLGDDLRVVVSLAGLAPGAHGVHLHETPACGEADADGDGTAEPGGAAGGHWDPLGTDDHGAATEDLDDKHLGDLGNVTAGADGTAEATFAIEAFPAGTEVTGLAVIVHAGRDDLEADPGGGSGARIGCGVVEAA